MGVWPSGDQLFKQWYWLSAVDSGIFDVVVIEFADQAGSSACSRQVVVMKGEQDAISGRMHICLYIYVSQIDCSLKRRHRVFWCVAGATAMRKSDRRVVFKKWMSHDGLTRHSRKIKLRGLSSSSTRLLISVCKVCPLDVLAIRCENQLTSGT